MRSYYRTKKEVLEYYSRLSRNYDEKRLGHVKGRLMSIFQIEWFLSMLGTRHSKLLEVGSGTGRLTSYLPNVSNLLIATDANLSMLRILKERISLQRARQQTELILCDASYLPLREKSIDGVIAARIFWHLSDFEKAIKESLRTLRNKGLLLFDFPNKTGPFMLVNKLYKTKNDVLTLFTTSNHLKTLGKNANVNVELVGSISCFLFFLPEKLFNMTRLNNILVHLSTLLERLGLFWPFKEFMSYWLVIYEKSKF